MLLSMNETIFERLWLQGFDGDNGTKALAVLSRDDVNVDMVVTDMVMRHGRARTRRAHPAAHAEDKNFMHERLCDAGG